MNFQCTILDKTKFLIFFSLTNTVDAKLRFYENVRTEKIYRRKNNHIRSFRDFPGKVLVKISCCGYYFMVLVNKMGLSYFYTRPTEFLSHWKTFTLMDNNERIYWTWVILKNLIKHIKISKYMQQRTNLFRWGNIITINHRKRNLCIYYRIPSWLALKIMFKYFYL